MIRVATLFLLLLLQNCASFKTVNLKAQQSEALLASVKITGEGKGRLGIESNQYLFSFDALLKKPSDWILAANIPIHGEEILQFTNLTSEQTIEDSRDPFEVRIEQGIAQYLKDRKKDAKLAGIFLRELRSMVRFLLAKEMGMEVRCHPSEAAEVCELGSTSYQLSTSNTLLTLKKSITDSFQIEYVAQNLTDSIFRRGSIYLYSQNSHSKRETLLSLELFWN